MCEPQGLRAQELLRECDICFPDLLCSYSLYISLGELYYLFVKLTGCDTTASKAANAEPTPNPGPSENGGGSSVQCKAVFCDGME